MRYLVLGLVLLPLPALASNGHGCFSQCVKEKIEEGFTRQKAREFCAGSPPCTGASFAEPGESGEDFEKDEEPEPRL